MTVTFKSYICGVSDYERDKVHFTWLLSCLNGYNVRAGTHLFNDCSQHSEYCFSHTQKNLVRPINERELKAD